MPWITKLESGRYRVGVYRNGRRKFKTFKKKKDAEDFERKLRKALGQEGYNLPGGRSALPTFREMAERWYADHVEIKCKPRTQEGYRDLLNLHVLPEWGDRPLDEIKRGDILTWVAGKMRDGAAQNTVRLLLSTISGVYSHAENVDLPITNPAKRPARFLGKKRKRKGQNINPLDENEVRTVLAITKEHFPRLYPIILAAFRTGCRQGELISWKWDAIDWKKKTILVSETYWKGEFGPVKDDEPRTVDLSNQLITLLADHRKRIAEESIKAGRKMPEVVFPNTVGEPMDADNLRKDFERILKKAGMRKIRFHDIRHTYASTLIQRGENLLYISRQLGHSTISITCDTYGHLIPGGNRDAIDRLDDHEWREGIGNKPATVHAGKEIGEPAYVG